MMGGRGDGHKERRRKKGTSKLEISASISALPTILSNSLKEKKKRRKLDKK